VPFLALECGADDAVPQPHTRMIHASVASRDKTFLVVDGANHYFVNQPDHLARAASLVDDWLKARGFG
jgi:alpha-beta hydrolase superfamily lysophospholipase